MEIFSENSLLEGLQEELGKDWGFKILDKDTTSSSMLILLEKPNITDEKKCPYLVSGLVNPSFAIKTWCRTTIREGDYNKRQSTRSEGSLEYEKRVYINKIRPLIKANPDSQSGYMPLLKYTGDDGDCSTVDVLADFLGIQPDMKVRKNLLYLAFYVTNMMAQGNPSLEDNIKPFNFMSVGLYSRLLSQLKKSDKDSLLGSFQNIGKWNIGAILMPNIKFRPFTDYIGNGFQAEFIQQIVKGLYAINKCGLVHNDLHPHNIMIEKRVGENPAHRVMIYDWDRSYSPTLGDNPMLNSETDIQLCRSSQCNLFMGQRPVDLLKILVYIARNKQTDLSFVLQRGLKLQNDKIDGYFRFDLIYNGIINCSPENYFYRYNRHSSLYKVDNCEGIEYAIDLLGGTLDIIYHNIFPDVEIQEAKHEPVMGFKSNTRNTVPDEMVPLINLFMGIVNERTKIFSEVDNSDTSVCKQLRSFARLYKTGKTAKISKLRTELKRIDLNSFRDKKASELTWREFNILRNAVDLIKFGIPQPVTENIEKKLPKWSKKRDFIDIMAEHRVLI